MSRHQRMNFISFSPHSYYFPFIAFCCSVIFMPSDFNLLTHLLLSPIRRQVRQDHEKWIHHRSGYQVWTKVRYTLASGQRLQRQMTWHVHTQWSTRTQQESESGARKVQKSLVTIQSSNTISEQTSRKKKKIQSLCSPDRDVFFLQLCWSWIRKEAKTRSHDKSTSSSHKKHQPHVHTFADSSRRSKWSPWLPFQSSISHLSSLH